MALAIAKAGHLKPEIRLAQAVSDFEAILSSEEKACLRNEKIKTHANPPNTQDVMRLTAELGRAKIGGNFLGPRAMNLILAAQQFASLGDVIVGGSQNLVACGVWSIVRMSLSALTMVTSHLDKVSTILLEVSRSAPSFDKIALLYPHSPDLQSFLHEYFTVVVRLCIYITELSRKSSLGKLGSAFNSSPLNEYEKALVIWGKQIRTEVEHMIATRVESEASANSRFRQFFSSKVWRYEAVGKRKERQSVLDFCSSYDHDHPWRQIRKRGNTSAFREAVKYKDWVNQGSTRTLVYVGKLGMGKSVLLANIVEELHLRTIEKTSVIHFFARFDDVESLQARTILGSLARQLLSQGHDLTEAAHFIDRMHRNEPIRIIVGLLAQTMSHNSRVFIILDGINEMKSEEKALLVAEIGILQKTFHHFSVCLSLRQTPSDPLSDDFSQLSSVGYCLMPENTDEIESFVQDKLEMLIESKDLILGDPTLTLEIQDALVKGAQGMFLWVALQMEQLCIMKTDNEIRQALRNLPKDLPDTFTRILQMANTCGNYQKRILELVIAARRPLTIHELREALSVVPGDTKWDPSSHVNDIYKALSCCGSLILVDEERVSVQFIHHSVKQFVTDEYERQSDRVITIESAHVQMSQIILTYLNYPLHNNQISIYKRSPIYGSSVMNRVTESLDLKRSLALELIKARSKKRNDCDISTTLAKYDYFNKIPRPEFGAFQLYSIRFWSSHMALSLPLPKIFDKLIYGLDPRVILAHLKPHDAYSLLKRVAITGSVPWAKILVESLKDHDWIQETRSHHTIHLSIIERESPLGLAFLHNSTEIVKILLESRDSFIKQTFRHPWVIYIITENRQQMGKVFLDSVCSPHTSPEIQEILRKSFALIMELLELVCLIPPPQEHVSNINELSSMGVLSYQDAWDSISKATKADRADIVEAMLLSRATSQPAGGDPINKKIPDSRDIIRESIQENFPEEQGKQQVHLAVSLGREMILKHLVSSGKVKCNSLYDETFFDSLSLCTNASTRHRSCQILLSYAPPNKEERRKALTMAIQHKQRGFMRELLQLERKWNANEKLDVFMSALHLAVEKNDYESTKILLDLGGSDLNYRDTYGRTALDYVLLWGSPDRDCWQLLTDYQHRDELRGFPDIREESRLETR